MEGDTATWAGTTVGGAGRCGKIGGISGVVSFGHGLLKARGRLTYFASSQICMYICCLCVLTISEAWVCFLSLEVVFYIESVAIVDGFDVWGPLTRQQ